MTSKLTSWGSASTPRTTSGTIARNHGDANTSSAEHEIVADYDAFRSPLRSLGRDIRLAVGDAGAGVANFGHIIDLGPDLVKRDESLIRRVNTHLGRQALVVGMRYFSRASGCRLVAEGVETEDEARTVVELGVEFGQGHWFGRPQPAGHFIRQGGSHEPVDGVG